MKIMTLGGAAAIAMMLAAPAFAGDLLASCTAVVEAEGQGEGAAGCECLVEQAGDDQALIDELIALAEVPAEERAPSDAAGAAIGACFEEG
ncbi:MAG: hypothetical protein AAGL49_00250 [Pseudomonadota bacterium]